MKLKQIFLFIILMLSSYYNLNALKASEKDLLKKIIESVANNKERLLKLSSIQYLAKGSRYASGENYTPEMEPFKLSNFTAELYAIYPESKISITYQYELLLYFLQTKFTEVINGVYGYFKGDDSFITRLEEKQMFSDRLGSTKRQFYLFNPQFIMYDIVKNQKLITKIEKQNIKGILYYIIFYNDPIQPITLFINEKNMQVNHLETYENNWTHGDSKLIIFYEDWEVINGIKIPKKVLLSLNGFIIYQEERQNIKIDEKQDKTLFVIPANLKTNFNKKVYLIGSKTSQFYKFWTSDGFNYDGIADEIFQKSNFKAFPITESIFLLNYGVHNSLVVAQENRVIFIDPNLSTSVGDLFIKWCKKQWPNKKITHVIGTHFHDDHMGCIRNFVSIGAKVVISEVNEDYIRNMIAAPHNIIKDNYHIKKNNINIDTIPIDSMYTIDDKDNPIEIYHIQNKHSNDLLVIYLPSQKILYNNDLFAPNMHRPGMVPPTYLQGSKDLLAYIKKKKLEINGLIGAHGIGSAPLSALEELVK